MIAVIANAHILPRRSQSKNEKDSTKNVQKVVSPHTGCNAECSNAHMSADQVHSQPMRLVNTRNIPNIRNIKRVSTTGENNEIPTISTHGGKFPSITLFCGGSPAAYKSAERTNVGNTPIKYAASTY